MPDSSNSDEAPPLVDHSLAAESLAVSFTVVDVGLSATWYCDALGFTVDREHEREGRVIAVSLRAGTVRILLSHDNGAKGPERQKGDGFSVQITTRQNIDALAARAKHAGAVLDTEPADVLGARVFRLRDPDGFRIVISSPRET